MKLWVKILSIGIIVLAVLFSATSLFIAFKGKAIIIKKLESLTQKKVSIDYFGLILPFNLEIKNLDIQGLAKADSIYVSPSLLGLLTGNIVLNEIKIIRPEFTYERFLPQVTESPTPNSISTTAVKSKKKHPLRLIFKRVDIKAGKIDFIDHTVSGDGVKITVKDINFNLTNLYMFPRSVITNFELKAKIPWQQEEGKIAAEGWLNLFKKDMQATLRIDDIDGIYFYPYYSTWVDLEKAHIEKAKLDFTSKIHSENNNLIAECHLELTDIMFKPRLPEELQEKAEKIAAAVLDIFKALNQGKIVLDFTIRTKMDKIDFGFGDIKMAFENRLAQGIKTDKFNIEDIITFPRQLLKGTVKSATDLTKAVINGTVSVGKEIKKTIEGAFKKEQEAEEE